MRKKKEKTQQLKKLHSAHRCFLSANVCMKFADGRKLQYDRASRLKQVSHNKESNGTHFRELLRRSFRAGSATSGAAGTCTWVTWGGLFVEFLEARNYAQVSLTIRTVIFSFTPQDTTVIVHCVPAIIASQCRPCPQFRAMPTSVGWCSRGMWRWNPWIWYRSPQTIFHLSL